MILQLKRCPWCNGHNLSTEVTAMSFQIKCFNCGAMGPFTTRKRENAAALWNGTDIHQNPSAILVRNDGKNRNQLKDVEV